MIFFKIIYDKIIDMKCFNSYHCPKINNITAQKLKKTQQKIEIQQRYIHLHNVKLKISSKIFHARPP